MDTLSRRSMLQLSGLSVAGASVLAGLGTSTAVLGDETTASRKARIRQSVSGWCYPKMTTDELAAYAAKIGMQGVDLLEVKEYDIPRRHGLRCTMGYIGAGDIPVGVNRVSNHAQIEQACRDNIPLAAKAGVPNVILFSGNREGMGDAEGIRNSITGLNRVKKIAEDNGVTICMELLNSHGHKDYMCDHTAWGVEVMQGVNSPNVKLLYDIFHMQIMEGNLIETITRNIQWIGHFHTGGVPGRHELDSHQEVQWAAVMEAIVATGYKGYVAHEFLPTRDPLVSLREAVDLCDV